MEHWLIMGYSGCKKISTIFYFLIHNKPQDFLEGMSSHFFNFLFKRSQCHQMEVLNERISEWPHAML